MILSNFEVQIPPGVVPDLRIETSGYSEESLGSKWKTSCSAALNLKSNGDLKVKQTGRRAWKSKETRQTYRLLSFLRW